MKPLFVAAGLLVLAGSAAAPQVAQSAGARRFEYQLTVASRSGVSRLESRINGMVDTRGLREEIVGNALPGLDGRVVIAAIDGERIALDLERREYSQMGDLGVTKLVHGLAGRLRWQQRAGASSTELLGRQVVMVQMRLEYLPEAEGPTLAVMDCDVWVDPSLAQVADAFSQSVLVDPIRATPKMPLPTGAVVRLAAKAEWLDWSAAISDLRTSTRDFSIAVPAGFRLVR